MSALIWSHNAFRCTTPCNFYLLLRCSNIDFVTPAPPAPQSPTSPTPLQAIPPLPLKVAHTSPDRTIKSRATQSWGTLSHLLTIRRVHIRILFFITIFFSRNFFFFHTAHPARREFSLLGSLRPAACRCGPLRPPSLPHLDLALRCGSPQVSIKVCWVWLLHFPPLCQVCQQQLLSPSGWPLFSESR